MKAKSNWGLVGLVVLNLFYAANAGAVNCAPSGDIECWRNARLDSMVSGPEKIESSSALITLIHEIKEARCDWSPFDDLSVFTLIGGRVVSATLTSKKVETKRIFSFKEYKTANLSGVLEVQLPDGESRYADFSSCKIEWGIGKQ